MALKLGGKKLVLRGDKTKTEKPDTEEGPNDHIGEQVDAPAGHSPRVVKTPMQKNADVNPKVHAAKLEDAAKRKANPTVQKAASSDTMGTSSSEVAPSVDAMPEQPTKRNAAPKAPAAPPTASKGVRSFGLERPTVGPSVWIAAPKPVRR